MSRSRRVDTVNTTQNIREMIKILPSRYIEIYRSQKTYTDRLAEGSEVQKAFSYRGDALYSTGNGVVRRFGLGQIETDSEFFVIPGRYDIQQGDFCDYLGRKYQVKFQPTWFDAFMIIELQQYQQGT